MRSRVTLLVLLLPLALAGCPRSTAKLADAGPASSSAPSAGSSASASASVSASASASASGPPAAPSEETAPAVALPRRSDVPATIAQGKTLVLEGILGAPEERNAPDASACLAPVKLDAPLKVVDEHGAVMTDGRGNGAHPTIGNAKRICLWSWKGWHSNDGWMIPWGSHVVVRGNLWPPMTGMHPRALLMFDTELLSATPPRETVPPGKMPDGDTVAYIRKYEPAGGGGGVLQLDVAFLYYGDAAQKLAHDRGETLPPGQIGYVVNESSQLRPWTLPPLAPGVEWPHRLEASSGGGYGWRSLREKDFVGDTPFLITIEKGKLTSFRQLSFEAH